MDFTETIEVKVLDKEEHFSFDSYFFAYFQNLPHALQDIRDAVRSHLLLPENNLPQTVMDTTLGRGSRHPAVDRTHSLPNPEPSRSSSASSRFSSLFRPFQETLSLGRAISVPEESDKEEFTHILRRGNLAITASPPSNPQDLPSPPQDLSSLTPTTTYRSDHTYPPSTSPVDSPRASIGGSSNSTVFWSIGVPSWLKGTSRRVVGTSSSSSSPPPSAQLRLEPATTASTTQTGISEVFSSLRPWNRQSGSSEIGFSVLESPGVSIDPEMTEAFRTAFAFDEKEPLRGCRSLAASS